MEAGCAALVGPRREAIVREASRLLSDPAAAQAMRKAANPFGDGQASRRIARAVMDRLVPATSETHEEETALAA